MNNLKVSFMSLGVATSLFVSGVVSAGVIKIDETAFNPDAGSITFSEFATMTVNPTYNPANYGGVGSTIVSFGGFFDGQRLGVAGECPIGAALTGCVVGSPVGSLALDPNSPNTFITTDSANPTSPVLSGSPTFNGAISILFSTDQAGVGLEGGYFDAIGGTAITAFDRNGNVIGSVQNEALGIEFLGLVTEDKVSSIAGIQFSLVGSEPAGFAIDNLHFGFGSQIVGPTPVPEPGTLALLGLGIAGLGLSRKKRIQK